MSPIAGFTRLRYMQIGKQTVIGTAVAATRALPWRGSIAVNPNRTYPDVDTGSLDPAMAPFAAAKEVTLSAEGKAAYNDLPYLFAAAGKGGVAVAGTTWTYTYASLTADAFDYFTVETGDDTTASDGLEGYGGVLNEYTLEFPNSLEAYDLSADWVFANGTLATAKTAALSVDSAPTWVYGANTQVYMDATAGGIGGTEWPDTVHGVSHTWNNNLDQKRFANGSNNPFGLAGYGRGEREIGLVLTVAKTTLSMAERATIDDDPVPTRFIRTKVTKDANYNWQRQGAWNLISATDGEIDGNTTIILTYRAIYDATLAYAAQDVVKNTLAAL